jgi:hypothetical protein
MAGLNFTEQVKREKDEALSNISNAVTGAAISAWKVAVDNTPRLTGNLQNSWKLSNTRRSSYIPTAGKKPRPSTPSFRFRVTIDRRVYLYNNVPYASYVENGEGPGVRIPRMMLARAIAHFHAELRRRLGR